MALDTAELMTLRDELIRARAKGIRSAQMGSERIDFKTDAEMLSAINDLEARISRASTPRQTTVLFSSSKGL